MFSAHVEYLNFVLLLFVDFSSLNQGETQQVGFYIYSQ